MKKLLAAFAENTVFANIVLVLLFLAGGAAAFSMVREDLPQMAEDIITIEIDYPGADPEEVEEGVCRKIEDAIQGLEGVKTYTTQAEENKAFAEITVKENYNAAEVLDSVRNRVNAVSTFPEEARKPVITRPSVKFPVMTLFISAYMSEFRLKEWANQIKNEILRLPEVSQVTISGAREYEINLEISEENLRKYKLSLAQVARAVRKSNLNLSGGIIRSQGEELRIRTLGRKYTGKELSSIVVLARANGETITLDKIAHIRDGFTDTPARMEVNGKPSILISIFKTQKEDAIIISDAVVKYVGDKQLTLPDGAEIGLLFDNTNPTRARISLLVKNGCMGMLIVFFLLWLFMNSHLSFWAGMGIPVSIVGGLAVMWSAGSTINMVSLFSLIMVLGIAADDAIIVGESIFYFRKSGLPPLEAAIKGVLEVGKPVTIAMITSIAAFIPLAFVGGVMGKFIAILPITVISCLIISLLECMVLLPAHLSHLPDPAISRSGRSYILEKIFRLQAAGNRFIEWFANTIYRRILKRVLAWRYVSPSIAFSVLLISMGILMGGFLKTEVMPETDGFIISSSVKFPEGTPIAMIEKAVNRMDEALSRLAEDASTKTGEPLIINRVKMIGFEPDDEVGETEGNAPHLGGVQAILLSSEKRGIHTNDLLLKWEKETGPVFGAKSVTYFADDMGPPGDPIEINILGRDMNQILDSAERLMGRLRQFKGVYQVYSDHSTGKNEIRFTLKPEARTLGVTLEDLARQVSGAYYGFDALSVQRSRDNIDIKVRYTQAERRNITSLERVRILTPAGFKVPLFTVADIKFAPGMGTITRTDGLRRVKISAELDEHMVQADDIIEELYKGFFQTLEKEYPDIYFDLRGDEEKEEESFGSLMVGFPLALIGIYMIIATMFRSYIQPFIILFTIPFGLIGGILGHLLLGHNMSLLSIFGMVALTGVVVNDAIVLIERINGNLAKGSSFFKAIELGGVRRFPAVFLTSISTVGGLLPLIFETNQHAQLLIPMAISIAAGIAFATVLTLLLIPSLFAILNDLRLLVYKIRFGSLPDRVDVEPASKKESDLRTKLLEFETRSEMIQ